MIILIDPTNHQDEVLKIDIS